MTVLVASDFAVKRTPTWSRIMGISEMLPGHGIAGFLQIFSFVPHFFFYMPLAKSHIIIPFPAILYTWRVPNK